MLVQLDQHVVRLGVRFVHGGYGGCSDIKYKWRVIKAVVLLD